MILVLHNPENLTTVWADIKSQIKIPGPVLVPHENIFGKFARGKILELCDRQDNPVRVLRKLSNITLRFMPQKTITGIEFLLCCLSQKHNYFEICMARIDELTTIVDMCMFGSSFYEFIERCSLVCIGAKIAEPFAESFDEQWFEQRLVPKIQVPLTPFGRCVVEYLISNANDYVSVDSFLHTGMNDGLAIGNWIIHRCTQVAELMEM